MNVGGSESDSDSSDPDSESDYSGDSDSESDDQYMPPWKKKNTFAYKRGKFVLYTCIRGMCYTPGVVVDLRLLRASHLEAVLPDVQ